MELVREHDHAVGLGGDANRDTFENSVEVILSVRIVIHTTGRWPNSTMSNNHVTMLLLLAGNRCIQFNMATEEDDTLGVLIWSSRAWQQSNSAITSLDIAVVGQPTIGRVYSLLRSNGAHRYQFSGGGSGCRHWVISTIQLLSRSQTVPTNSVGTLVPFLNYQYSRAAPRMQITIMQGTFLDEQTWFNLWNADDSSDESGSEDEEDGNDEDGNDEDGNDGDENGGGGGEEDESAPPYRWIRRNNEYFKINMNSGTVLHQQRPTPLNEPFSEGGTNFLWDGRTRWIARNRVWERMP